MSAPIVGTLDPSTGANLGYQNPGSIGDLQLALQRRSAVLAALSTAPTGPYIETENGRSVSFTAYRKSLLDELDALNKLIPILAGPVEISQRVR